MELTKITLRQARKLAEKTQKEMAGELGINVKTYRNLETNPELTTIAQAKKIAELTGIEYYKIFFAS